MRMRGKPIHYCISEGNFSKHHISDYKDWDQREHAKEWMIFEKNMGTHLSIDETALSNDELYTVITNKTAKGQKGAIVAMIRGTQADKVIEVLQRISKRLRQRVQEVTLGMAAGMHLIVKRCFPYAHRVVDRFHVQQLACEAVQEICIKHRWHAYPFYNGALTASIVAQDPMALSWEFDVWLLPLGFLQIRKK
jgi:transposase